MLGLLAQFFKKEAKMANDLQIKISSMLDGIKSYHAKIEGVYDSIRALSSDINDKAKMQSTFVNSLFGLISELIDEAIQNYNKSDGLLILDTHSGFCLEYEGIRQKSISGIPVNVCSIVVAIPVCSIKRKSGESIGKTEAILMCGNQFLDLNRTIVVHIDKVFQQNGIDSNGFSFRVEEQLSLD